LGNSPQTLSSGQARKHQSAWREWILAPWLRNPGYTQKMHIE
jgi:hypothetical protein